MHVTLRGGNPNGQSSLETQGKVAALSKKKNECYWKLNISVR